MPSRAATPVAVPGQSYNICDETAQYLTSPWTYSAAPLPAGMGSPGTGSEAYTIAQYEAIPGYGTTLPPLPSYIAGEAAGTEAAVIFKPGATSNLPAYDFPETPMLYFFEGGSYGPIGLDSISGDQFIGGSASGFPEPAFDDANNADGIDAGNGSHYFSGGDSTLSATASSGATTVTTTAAIPGYISYITFADGSTYQIANVVGTTITLNSALSSTESAGSQVWANTEQPLAEISASAAQGGATVTLGNSSIPLVNYASVVIGSDTYTLTSVAGSQSGYTIGVGSLDTAVGAKTPVYYNAPAGGVTVSYLDIAHDSHVTTGTITTGSAWTITHNNIHDGYMNASGTPTPGDGVAIYGGDQGTIEYNCLSKMGDYGINVFGTNNKFDYNEVYESNYEPDPGCGCSGGGKWWGTLNADIVDNAFINDSPGGSFPVWLDNGNSGTLIQGNYFDKSVYGAISSETGFNLDIDNNMFLDGGWGTGSGCGDSNCAGSIGLNSSGGFNVPGSRYENEILITNNQFFDDWGGVTVWQSGGRSCENSGEGWPNDAAYCSGGFPNTAAPAAGGQYYFSHIGDDNHNFGALNLVTAASAGSTTLLLNGSEATDDQIGFVNNPVSTTTTSTTNVSSLNGSSTINAASTAGFPSSGQLRVGTSAAWSDGQGSWTGAILAYTGTTGTSFTGVSLVRGSGTLSGPVQQVQPYKVTGETCYANDCKVSITPSLASSEAAGTEVSGAGTCQLFATSAATPTSPLAPDGTSYFDGCQWGTKGISVTGNTFQFDPTTIANSAPLTGGTSTTCTAAHANFCGTNFMAYQESGEPPFDSFVGGNAMMSSSTFTGCPSWDSGCASNPLANINALSNPPNAAANNNEPPENSVWANNTYIGPWLWYADYYGTCGQEPSDTNTGKSMPGGACAVDFTGWQADWQQDAGSSYTSTTTPPPSTPNNVTATANSSTSVTVSWSASTDTGGPGLGGYYILRNGTQVGSVNATTTTFNDPSVVAGTTYNYTVQAYDTANPADVSAASANAAVTTPSGSANSPTVSVPGLTDNGTNHGNSVGVNASITPVAGNTISNAKLLVNGATAQTITSSPYNFIWNTLNYNDGTYTVTVQATDNQSNVGVQNFTEYVTNGDLNGDGRVGLSDLIILAQNYGKAGTFTYAQGNITSAGTSPEVNLGDLIILAKNYGYNDGLGH